MERGTEKTVTCEADEFYPKDITFQWIKYQRGSGNVLLQKGVSYTHPIANEDGTFSQSSFLRINPTLEDNGNVYSCNVSHRSMGTDLQLNLTLSVTEPDTQRSQIIGAVVGAGAAVALVALSIYLYIMFCRKEPPKLSPITGAEHLVHMNEATLSCQISGFRPKPIRITLWLRRNGGEVMEIYSWDSKKQSDQCGKSDKQLVAIELEREGLVGNGDSYLPPAQRALRVEMVPVITTSKYRISNCQCTIRITPDIEEDDGAELTVRVTHSALRGPISVSCRLEVRGVKPKLSKIVFPLRILHEEPVTLTCPINGFKPKPLSVTWLKVDPLGQETELLSWDRGTTDICDPQYSHQLAENEREWEEEEEDDHINYFLSNVTLLPTVRGDHGAQYVCRTHHYATGERAEKRMEMQVLAAPELGPIQKSPEILYVGEEMTLSCRIHSFHPEILGVCWYKGDELLASSTDQAHRGDSHLLDCTSRATYRPSVRDIGKSFRCEVSHESLQHPKCVSWELKHLISEPRVSAIKCHPEVPECNQPATLSCAIENYYPKVLTIQWYRGLKVISIDNDPKAAEEDQESGLFSRTSEIQIIPTINDHGTEFYLKITHCMKNFEKNFPMKLRGLPDVKDITCNTYPPKYGEALTLSCEVIGCSARDITAEWRVGNNPIKREMEAKTQIDRDSITFLLTLTPTAEHHGKLFTCLIKHKDLPQPIRKIICLKLLASGDQLDGGIVPKAKKPKAASDRGETKIEEIECVTPPSPREGEAVTLQCIIRGQDVQHGDFSWSDGMFPIDESQIDNSNLPDGSGCISRVTFTPDDGQIRFEATINLVTTERTYQISDWGGL
uniref:Ig-like domain-containing protein n=1 Tax=Xenopus tropicalis TaxID=8364 RepID=A0A1B8Y4X4_XENTR